jgi:hypothetical protein
MSSSLPIYCCSAVSIGVGCVSEQMGGVLIIPITASLAAFTLGILLWLFVGEARQLRSRP